MRFDIEDSYSVRFFNIINEYSLAVKLFVLLILS